MSTYVLMRILESSPSRYELGMRLLTLGRVDRVYDRVATRIQPGWRVLDLGCGPGALALRAARRGASVRALDVDPAMLEIAASRAREAGLEARVEFVQQGVGELDELPAGSCDAATTGLCLSELGPDELSFALRHLARVLRPGGLLLVVDEVRAGSGWARALQRLLRAPLVLVTWLVTQQSSRPLRDLPQRVAAAGLTVESFRAPRLGGLAELVAIADGGEVQ